ncbi:haloacid dehalogenase-like hydrolase family protein [Cryptosporidium felis]|nr:haloacid dehalogenase-like hydrolase family protein [Cryptosporidium felis]
MANTKQSDETCSSHSTEPAIEAERQQHIVLGKKRFITFNLTEICDILGKVMEQQGDESVVTYGDIDWNLIASTLDKDPFELEYFWRTFNPKTHFKPSLGCALVPVELSHISESKLLYSNTDHRTNLAFNYDLQNALNHELDLVRSQTTLKPLLELAKLRVDLLNITLEASKNSRPNMPAFPP